MEKNVILWTFRTNETSWTAKDDPFVVLSEILEPSWEGQILISSEQPENDKTSICAVLKIIRRLRDDISVIVGTPHPTIELSEIFRNSGASALWAVDLKYQPFLVVSKIEIADRMAIERPVCPALHLEKDDPIELSVCGKRNNRLILVMSYFRKWCLSEYEDCPYWRGTYNDC